MGPLADRLNGRLGCADELGDLTIRKLGVEFDEPQDRGGPVLPLGERGIARATAFFLACSGWVELELQLVNRILLGLLNFLGSNNDVPIRVLYVDKSATSTAITTTILQKNGVEYQHFKEAPEALEFLKNDIKEHGKCSMDVMVTDLTLSGNMHGFALIQAIRNELELDYLALPVLLMTIEPGEDE